METTVFKAVEESMLEVVYRKGNNYWHTLHSARKLIGDSYSNEGLATQNATTLPFSEEALRWAYVHLYVTPHTHMVEDIMGRFWTSSREFRLWHDKLNGGHVRVCCVGGGPGTDILGLALFIRKHRLNLAGIRGHVLDQWTEWEETFCTLARHLDPQGLVLPAGGMGINYWELHFHQAWERYSSSWKYLQCLRDADLVTMVKFVSAVASDKEGCEKKLILMLQLMKPGALLFFLDNAGGGYATIVRHAAATAGFYQIGKFEHRDVGLPDNEATAVNSSKLRLPKTKADKIWKISAYLWQKGDAKPSGKSSKKRSRRKSNPKAMQQPVNIPSPHIHQWSETLPVRNAVLPQFRISPQAPSGNLPQSSSTQPNANLQAPNTGYKIPQSITFHARAPNNNLAHSPATHIRSKAPSSSNSQIPQPVTSTSQPVVIPSGTIRTNATTTTATVNTPLVQTSQLNSVRNLPQTYQSDTTSQYRITGTSSYQHYNPTPPSRPNYGTMPVTVSPTANSASTSRLLGPPDEEQQLGCCSAILAALGKLCR